MSPVYDNDNVNVKIMIITVARILNILYMYVNSLCYDSALT